MHDVAVIGGGLAALCAAISARGHGANVVLLDRAPAHQRGGNTRHSRNLRIVHDQPLPQAPGRYTADELADDLAAIGGTRDPALIEALAEGSRALPDWLQRQGAALESPARGGIPWSRRTVFLLGGGQALVNALYRRAEGLGVDIRHGAHVLDLPLGTDGPGAMTVQWAPGGGAAALSAKRIVAACGGYAADTGRLAAYWSTTAERFRIRGMPYADGEVLDDLLRQGVAPSGEPGACHFVAVDGRAPAADGGIVTRADGMHEGIVVDGTGRRFADEGAEITPRRYSWWGQRLARLPGQRAFLVLDADGVERAPPSIYPPYRGGRVEGLAEQLGLPPEALASEVGAFNRAVARSTTGRTADTEPPKSRRARPLVTPPFAAYPMAPGVTFAAHGVRVDARARVLDHDGRPAWPGVHAAGTLMSPALLGTGYTAGISMTVGAVFGRIAGEEAARGLRD